MQKRLSAPTRRSAFALTALVAVLAGSGCTGIVDSDGSMPAPSRGSAGAGSAPSASAGSAGGVSTEPDACLGTSGIPAAAPARRLTRAEFSASVADLLLDQTSPGIGLPPELIGNLFSNDSEQQPASFDLISAYNTIAADIATRATQPETLAKLAPCAAGATAGSAQDSCASSFIQSFARRAFRRPLAVDESAALLALEQAVTAQGSFASGLAAVIEATLQSPDFLYRIERGVPDPKDPTRRRPSGDEMATRLSFLFWGFGPDDTLREAAARGDLLTDEGVRIQAKRLLDDPRSHGVVRYFFDNLFPITTLTDLARDSQLYPSFSSKIGNYMRQETETFLENEIFSGTGSWPSILTADYTFLNEPLAAFYGITGVTGMEFRKVPLDTSKRRGLLTQGAVMTGTTVTNSTNPVLRGSFIVNKLLCMNVGLPSDPAILSQVKVPEDVVGTTARERFSEHSAQAVCRACHNIMDPVGFAFENYDAVGQFRTMEAGKVIDASGKIPDLGGERHSLVNGGIEIARQLAESESAQRCFAQHWVEYGYGRTLHDSPEEQCLQQKLNAAFKTSGYNVKQLMLDLTQMPAFLYLPSQG